MLKIKNLSKSYFSNKILEDISLSIKEGELTTLLGENGCGKSTLLNILSGYELPDEGQVTYKDVSLGKINFPFIHDIFFVHEKIDYMLKMNIDEYINLLKEKIPNWNEVIFQQMVKDRKIDLAKNFQSYSRGQRMQISLMIGLASSAKVLLLDEITSVIDVYGRKYFLDLLEKYVEQGNTVVITTNIINELEYYTDNLIVIKDKKIALNQSVKAIPDQFIKLRKTNNTEHDIFKHEKCIWAGVNSDKSVSYILPKGILDETQIPQELLDRRQATLEDVFIYFFNNYEVENTNESAA